MLSEQATKPNKLFNLIYNAVNSYCQKNNLKHIPVVYGAFKKESAMEFNITNPAIQVPRDYSVRLKQYIPRDKVWHLLEALGHELKHYEQYIRLERAGIPIRKELFSQEEAEQAGIKHAKDNINKYSTEEINPIRYVDGWQWGKHGKVYPKREQALTQQRAAYFAGYRGRNPKVTETVGNFMGSMGILAIPLIAGLILWIQSKVKTVR